MGIRVHGVIGGPRQKVSTPRTRVDLTNKVDPKDYFSSVETVIVSTRDNKIEFTKHPPKKIDPPTKPKEPIKKQEPIVEEKVVVKEESIIEEKIVVEEKLDPPKKRKKRTKKSHKSKEIDKSLEEVIKESSKEELSEDYNQTQQVSVNDWLLKLSSESDQSS